MIEERDEEELNEKPGRARRVPIDAPEADALEQEREWAEEEEIPHVRIPIDAPEADALDQEREAGLDEDEYEH